MNLLEKIRVRVDFVVRYSEEGNVEIETQKQIHTLSLFPPLNSNVVRRRESTSIEKGSLVVCCIVSMLVRDDGYEYDYDLVFASSRKRPLY